MAEITDVYLKIIYKKNNKIMEDDLFKDEDLLGILFSLEYDGIDFIDEVEGIILSKGRWCYLNTFKDNPLLLDELYTIAASKKIDDIFYLYCDSSEIMEKVDFGIVHLNIKENKSPEYLIIETNKFEDYVINNFISLKEKYILLSNGNLEENIEDELASVFLEELEEISYPYLTKKFKEFTFNIKNKVELFKYQPLFKEEKKKTSLLQKALKIFT